MTTAGDAWIHVEWDRITRRDGTAFVVHGYIATTDEQGTSGIPGVIDLRELGALTYTRGLTSVAEIATILTLKRQESITTRDTTAGQTETRTEDPRNKAADILVGRLGTVANEIAQGAIPKPTVEIAPGTIVRLVTTRDLWLRPAAGHMAYAKPPQTDQSQAAPSTERDTDAENKSPTSWGHTVSAAPITARQRREEQQRTERRRKGREAPAAEHAWEEDTTTWTPPGPGPDTTKPPRQISETNDTIPAAGARYGPANPPGQAGSGSLSWERPGG